MLPHDFLGDLPENLSRQAARDLIAILRRSAFEFGIDTARRSRTRLVAQCQAIGSGKSVGHRRHDVNPKTPTLFLTQAPWVISYNPHTRQITRILHGARDFPALFGGD